MTAPIIGATLNSEKVVCESMFQVSGRQEHSNKPNEFVHLCVQLQLSTVHSSMSLQGVSFTL